jgi:hypothetical protein
MGLDARIVACVDRRTATRRKAHRCNVIYSRKTSCSWDDYIVKVIVGDKLNFMKVLLIAALSILYMPYCYFFLSLLVCLILIDRNYIFTKQYFEEFYLVWNMTSYNLANVSRCFGGIYPLQLRGRRVIQANHQHEACSKHSFMLVASLSCSSTLKFIVTAVRTSNPK